MALKDTLKETTQRFSVAPFQEFKMLSDDIGNKTCSAWLRANKKDVEDEINFF